MSFINPNYICANISWYLALEDVSQRKGCLGKMSYSLPFKDDQKKKNINR